MYSDLYTNNRPRIPNFVLAIGAMLSLGVFGFFVSQSYRSSQASAIGVKSQEVSNITAHSAWIVWQTEKPTTGYVLYGESEGNIQTLVPDMQDGGGSRQERRLHVVEIQDLKEKTNYFYKIVVNNAPVKVGETTTLRFTTVITAPVQTTNKPLYGKVALTSGEGAEGALVTVRVPGSYPLSTFTKASGQWLIPMQNLYDSQTLTARVLTSLDEKLVIDIVAADLSRVSSIKTLLRNTMPISETTILGQNYSYLEDQILGVATDKKTGANGSKTLEILYPKDNAIVASSQPIIKGYAPKGGNVAVTLNTVPPIRVFARVDQSGEWSAPVNQPLAPGNYLLTVAVSDETGYEARAERIFTIAKSGEQIVLGEANGISTPSATPRVSPTLALVASITQFVPPPITNVVTPMPTPAPPSPPVSGYNPLTLIVASIAFVAAGVAFALLY